MLLNDDEDEISDDEDMKIDDAEDENGTDQEIDAETLRKPNIVTAMSLLIQELDHFEDIEELNTLLTMRMKKIRQSEVFEV
ncbi:unnamed protein product [Oikopleura dioica]|uniref:Uncharacterized protein n=1 Tax=Oikopleura dioica TaxID=34765 RepID=E4XVM4_OIKDI|nr:unnamed protein product [Oikopleura dioica]